MIIVSIKHKGLRRFVETGDASKLPPAIVEKLRRQLSILQDMGEISELEQWPHWKPHRLSDGAWSLHVTRNWRLTFYSSEDGIEISDLNYEDYH